MPPARHRRDSGGSVGLKRVPVEYELVKVWSTAIWSAVEVVRHVKRASLVFPLPSLSYSHRAWLLPCGGLVSVILSAKIAVLRPARISICLFSHSAAPLLVSPAAAHYRTHRTCIWRRVLPPCIMQHLAPFGKLCQNGRCGSFVPFGTKPNLNPKVINPKHTRRPLQEPLSRYEPNQSMEKGITVRRKSN